MPLVADVTGVVLYRELSCGEVNSEMANTTMFVNNGGKCLVLLKVISNVQNLEFNFVLLWIVKQSSEEVE